MLVRYLGDKSSLVSVIKDRTYECLGEEMSSYRIIDESDEDYLYPCELFEVVESGSKIDIEYMKSEAGLGNCFSIIFARQELIPKRYFEEHNDEAVAEVYFYLDIFKERNIFSGKKEDIVKGFEEYIFN